MRFKLVNTTPRTFVVVFDPMDEVMKGLAEFRGIRGSQCGELYCDRNVQQYYSSGK